MSGVPSMPSSQAGQRLISARAFWLKFAVCIGFMAGLVLSHKLWISSRSYPLTPVLSFLKPVGPWFDEAVFVTLLVLLALIVVVANPAKLIAGFVSVAVVCALFDQSRWQPWVYQYLFLLTAIGFFLANQAHSEKRDAALHTCRLIIASTYVWSGIQKINPGFVQHTFPWMIEPFIQSLPAAVKLWLHPLGFVMPFVELGTGIGLLTRKFRNFSVLVALAMHLVILASIGPWGHNYNNVVWPWNIAMGAFVILLFAQEKEASPKDVLWNGKFAFQMLVLILFGILPAFSLFNLWDGYLSSALYPGTRNAATIYMTGAVAAKLPGDVQEFVTEDAPNEDELAVAAWSWGEMNVPPYPEIRIFKSIGKRVCRDAVNPSDVKLVVQGKTTFFEPGRQLVFDCDSLAK
jgi:uncharacterized membrane protein YphA (DoxX/SURF4 family)